jgi:hypothetical protein
VPRPKSELTKNGKIVAVRVTESEFTEYERLGRGKWLRNFLQKSRDKQKKEERNREQENNF